ncbi:MAG: hypothetical protein LBR23_01650 [Spirochaetaceae bacterium]|jgi:hypothetical protein|nr:hypothetical protein [Spirochaetaceae bacterium]
MAEHELFDKSPIRLVDKLCDSPLGAGDMALVVSKKGLGKTSVLVQFGIDYLLRDKQVVHVSFDQKSANVITWYANLFAEIAKKGPPSAKDSLTDLVKKRVILNLSQDARVLPRIIATAKALGEGGIKAQCLLIDDVNFSTIGPGDFALLRDYAGEAGIFVCVSAAAEGENLESVLPGGVSFDALFRLVSLPDMIEFRRVLPGPQGKKAPPPPVRLKVDSKTLLLTEV